MSPCKWIAPSPPKATPRKSLQLLCKLQHRFSCHRAASRRTRSLPLCTFPGPSSSTSRAPILNPYSASSMSTGLCALNHNHYGWIREPSSFAAPDAPFRIWATPRAARPRTPQFSRFTYAPRAARGARKRRSAGCTQAAGTGLDAAGRGQGWSRAEETGKKSRASWEEGPHREHAQRRERKTSVKSLAVNQVGRGGES